MSPPSGGDLQILGLDPRRDGPRIRARLGVVPQQDSLDGELTVRDNLIIYGRYFGLSRAECRSRADELLEFANLTERADSLVEPLSGGMKRRLTIARALINRPEILLLDEPTTGSTRKPGTCCGTACSGSSAKASRSCSRRTTWTRPSSCATGWS